MTSIDREQPEENHEDLAGAKAIAKIKELVDQASTGFLCTAITTGRRIETRPMAVQQVDARGHLWFLSASDSTQNAQLATDARVQLMFQGSAHSDFLTLYGTATVTRDPAKIDELWDPMLKIWFTEGPRDPRITVIEVTPSDGYYWDTKHNKVVMFAKMVAGAITGTTLDDSIQGTIKPGRAMGG